MDCWWLVRGLISNILGNSTIHLRSPYRNSFMGYPTWMCFSGIYFMWILFLGIYLICCSKSGKPQAIPRWIPQQPYLQNHLPNPRENTQLCSKMVGIVFFWGGSHMKNWLSNAKWPYKNWTQETVTMIRFPNIQRKRSFDKHNGNVKCMRLINIGRWVWPKMGHP